jgi:hypothetical protein
VTLKLRKLSRLAFPCATAAVSLESNLWRSETTRRVPALLGLLVRLINIGANVNRDDRVLRRRGVAGELDNGFAVRGLEARHERD